MIILLAHEKGGTGKSTLATNLAVEFTRLGKAVSLVDADRQANASRWADDRSERGHEPTIFTVQKLGLLNKTLPELNENYDVVLVDVAGRDSQEMRSAMVCADVLLIPTQSGQFDLDGLLKMNDMIEEVRIINPEIKVFVAISRVSTNIFESESSDTKDYVAELPEMEVLQQKIYERKAYRDVIPEGLSVIEYTNGKAKAEIQGFVQELMSKW